MTEQASSNWHIYCSPDRFEELRGNIAFHRLLDLARHVNALRFAQVALVHVGDSDEPSAARQRSSVFFYYGGILYEALQLIPLLREQFGTLEAWVAGFGGFGSDEDVRAMVAQGTDLHRLRNHLAFHVRPMVTTQSLPRLNLPNYDFATGTGRSVGAVYYNLSDTLAIHYLVGSPTDYDEFMRRFVDRASQVRDLALRYMQAADKLIPAALKGLGFRGGREENAGAAA
jgi:hypothetical protein